MLELYCANEDAPKLWDELLEAGAADGLIPCGLAARDTLRLEAAMPLYGHEMDDEITPLETGLAAFVKLGKEAPFIGRERCFKKARRSVHAWALQMTGRGIAREHCAVYIGGGADRRDDVGHALPVFAAGGRHGAREGRVQRAGHEGRGGRPRTSDRG